MDTLKESTVVYPKEIICTDIYTQSSVVLKEAKNHTYDNQQQNEKCKIMNMYKLTHLLLNNESKKSQGKQIYWDNWKSRYNIPKFIA